MTSHPKYFNLIEMAFTIGILAVGAICITSILPVGVKENKVAMGENYSAHASESMQAYITRKASVDTPSWINIKDAIPTDTEIPAESSTSTMNAGSWNSSNWLEGDLYYPTPVRKGVYGIRMQTGTGTSTSSAVSYDFTGELIVWRNKLNDLYYGGLPGHAPGDTEAIGVHMEISWPVEVPYAYRSKRYYYFEMFNFNN